MRPRLAWVMPNSTESTGRRFCAWLGALLGGDPRIGKSTLSHCKSQPRLREPGERTVSTSRVRKESRRPGRTLRAGSDGPERCPGSIAADRTRNSVEDIIDHPFRTRNTALRHHRFIQTMWTDAVAKSLRDRHAGARQRAKLIRLPNDPVPPRSSLWATSQGWPDRRAAGGRAQGRCCAHP